MSHSITKLCPQCGQEKPVSEFPLSSRKKPVRLCKICHAQRQKTYTLKRKHEASNPSESATIAEMKRHGIFATSGKASDYHYVDVVAWGCVRVEVKLAAKDGNGYSIAFTDDQVKYGIRGELVVIIIPSQFGDAYYVLPANCPLFYSDGRLLFHISITMNSQRDTGRWQLLSRYRDAWHLVEESRQCVIQNMDTSSGAPAAMPIVRVDRPAPEMHQLPLL